MFHLGCWQVFQRSAYCTIKHYDVENIQTVLYYHWMFNKSISVCMWQNHALSAREVIEFVAYIHEVHDLVRDLLILFWFIAVSQQK